MAIIFAILLDHWASFTIHALWHVKCFIDAAVTSRLINKYRRRMPYFPLGKEKPADYIDGLQV